LTAQIRLGYSLCMIVPTKAAKAFDKMIEEKEIAPDSVASRLGVSISSVYNYRSGRAEPPLEIAFKIEDFYKIPARDWVPR
jgi:transcriptional regulator with XRE-family HTH domain